MSAGPLDSRFDVDELDDGCCDRAPRLAPPVLRLTADGRYLLDWDSIEVNHRHWFAVWRFRVRTFVRDPVSVTAWCSSLARRYSAPELQGSWGNIPRMTDADAAHDP